jgi:hypothetical protein
MDIGHFGCLNQVIKAVCSFKSGKVLVSGYAGVFAHSFRRDSIAGHVMKRLKVVFVTVIESFTVT